MPIAPGGIGSTPARWGNVLDSALIDSGRPSLRRLARAASEGWKDALGERRKSMRITRRKKGIVLNCMLSDDERLKETRAHAIRSTMSVSSLDSAWILSEQARFVDTRQKAEGSRDSRTQQLICSY
ncbi:hypothetical protein QCA50_010524 [Cerrena zonata]|uniref:Uncharacterized protein n=1 Tax=Cerrena zonata TaxID=2478898 RepID=A0AAW0G593_9APHY